MAALLSLQLLLQSSPLSPPDQYTAYAYEMMVDASVQQCNCMRGN